MESTPATRTKNRCSPRVARILPGVPVGGGAATGPKGRRQRSPWHIATLPATPR